MTNGEKIETILNVDRDCTEVHGENGTMTFTVTQDWWNTKYKEPKCKWIKYDYRTMCPKGHDVDNPYWRIPENRMETLKYCPYCGKEIEVEL